MSIIATPNKVPNLYIAWGRPHRRSPTCQCSPHLAFPFKVLYSFDKYSFPSPSIRIWIFAGQHADENSRKLKNPLPTPPVPPSFIYTIVGGRTSRCLEIYIIRNRERELSLSTSTLCHGTLPTRGQGPLPPSMAPIIRLEEMPVCYSVPTREKD